MLARTKWLARHGIQLGRWCRDSMAGNALNGNYPGSFPLSGSGGCKTMSKADSGGLLVQDAEQEHTSVHWTFSR